MHIMKPNCEICDRDLPPESPDARVCSFECTFCADCTNGPCPNCSGDLQIRPTRIGAALERHPASTKRVHAT